MNLPRKFDSEKTIEAILYIANNVPSFNATIYPVIKLLYFADKLHLEKYGRQITGDQYVAMQKGPVPSQSYDILKSVRGDGCHVDSAHAAHSFSINNHFHISLLRDIDLDIFSDSEIECLNQVIQENGDKGFGQLKAKSHDSAFEQADENDFMSLESIIRTLPNSDLIMEHMADPYPG